MSKINIVLDATMLSTYKACPRKFDYRFNHNKTTPLKPRALDRGTIMHLGFEAYYNVLKENKPWDSGVSAGLVAIRIGLTDSDLSIEDGNRCLEVFEEACKRWRIEDLSWEIVAVEQAFSFLLYEDEIGRAHV